MAAILLLIVIAILLGIGAFAVKALLWIALALLALWAIGWFVRPEGRRWYYW